MKKNALRKHNDFIYNDCSVEIAMLFWNSQKKHIMSALRGFLYLARKLNVWSKQTG